MHRGGIPITPIKKLAEGNPNLIDYLKNGEVSLIINTPNGKGARTDEGRIRAAAVQFGVPCITTVSAARIAIEAMAAARHKPMEVCHSKKDLRNSSMRLNWVPNASVSALHAGEMCAKFASQITDPSLIGILGDYVGCIEQLLQSKMPDTRSFWYRLIATAADIGRILNSRKPR